MLPPAGSGFVVSRADFQGNFKGQYDFTIMTKKQGAYISTGAAGRRKYSHLESILPPVIAAAARA